MGLVTRTYDFVDNTVAEADEVDTDFNTIYDEFNGSIDGDNISSSAALSVASLSLSGTLAITGSATFKKTIQTVVTATDGATVTFDLSSGNIQQVTLGGNRTLALSNVSVGQCFILNLIQDGTGSRTATFFTTIKWADGSAPTLTTTAAKTDSVGFICVSTGNYQGYVVGQNI